MFVIESTFLGRVLFRGNKVFLDSKSTYNCWCLPGFNFYFHSIVSSRVSSLIVSIVPASYSLASSILQFQQHLLYRFLTAALALFQLEKHNFYILFMLSRTTQSNQVLTYFLNKSQIILLFLLFLLSTFQIIVHFVVKFEHIISILGVFFMIKYLS